MRIRQTASLLPLFAFLLVPVSGFAAARLVNVAPADGGCVAGPTGPAVQAWDVQPTKTYTITLDQVTDCANGGTDATIQVIVMNSVAGNTVLTANKTATGVYQFAYTLPAGICETSPIKYCTVGGSTATGTFAGRSDTGAFQGHLRAAVFGPGCTNPTVVSCVTPTRPRSWGTLKLIYR